MHIAMELCGGGELFDSIVEAGNFSERKAAEVFRKMVEVVHHCQQLGVMHRDLKPENFLLTSKSSDGELKLTDFGLGVFFKPGERFKDLVGSPYYVAPEVGMHCMHAVGQHCMRVVNMGSTNLIPLFRYCARTIAMKRTCGPWG